MLIFWWLIFVPCILSYQDPYSISEDSSATETTTEFLYPQKPEPLPLSSSSSSSPSTSSSSSSSPSTVQLQSTPEPPSTPHPSTHKNREGVASRMSHACYPNDFEKNQTFNAFVYNCLLRKHTNLTNAENHWNFCCRLSNRCPTIGTSSNQNCGELFCDCLDLVGLNIAPSIDECNSNSLNNKTCKDLTPFANRYLNIHEDVGFGAIYGKNLVFGTAGIIVMLLFLIIFLCATSYLIVSYVQFKCHKVQKDANDMQEGIPGGEGRGDNHGAPQAPIKPAKFHDMFRV